MSLHTHLSFLLGICTVKNIKMFQYDFRLGSHFLVFKISNKRQLIVNTYCNVRYDYQLIETCQRCQLIAVD